jgi:signal transduction histidine kinase
VLHAFDAILRLAEIEAGSARSRFVAVDAAALVERVADAYRPDVEASSRTLETIASTGVWIYGDGELLAQALANLIENAMRHTPAGTNIKLSAIADGSTIHLEVADNGPGISPSKRDQALQPFRQLDNSRSRPGPGAEAAPDPGFGLGLSIVAAIARLHDAALELADASPGLRVIITFKVTSIAGHLSH